MRWPPPKSFPGVTGDVTFNENRDAVKPIVMIEIKPGGAYAVKERVQVEGAAMPGASTTVSGIATRVTGDERFTSRGGFSCEQGPSFDRCFAWCAAGESSGQCQAVIRPSRY